ncbi:MAG: MlaD family protein [Phycisphaerales bacterium]
MRASRNNIMAGVFVLGSLAAAFAIALTLGKAGDWAVPKNEYVVQFSLADGAVGLKQGSQVKVGGQPVGLVRTVQIQKDGDGAAQVIDVVVAVRKDLTLYKNASVFIELPLLGTVSTINIPAVGTETAGRLEPGSKIKGTLSPPAFLSQAGYGEVQKGQMQIILEKGSQIAEDIKAITADVKGRVGPVGDQLTDILKRVKEFIDEANRWVAEWGPKVTSALDTANVAAKNLDAGIDDARKLIATGQKTIDDNRPRIDSIIKNADEAMTKINEKIVKDIEDALSRANGALQGFRETGEKLNALVAEQTPEIRLTLANLRLASDQLKLTMAEIRRNPWRVLYSPGKKELEQELVYDAARSFAQAASDLNAASASLESVMAAAKASGQPVDAAQVKFLTDSMTDAFKRYRAAEEQFRKRLFEMPDSK